MDNLSEEETVEDVGYVDQSGHFFPNSSRIPSPQITTVAHKNRGSLALPPPRKVTYDDILSSLNMKVIDGKLQIVRNVAIENLKTNNISPQQNQKQQQQQQMPQHRQHYDQSPQLQPPQQQHIPLSKEQYKQIAIANYMKQMQQQQRIKHMKSTKMKFV